MSQKRKRRKIEFASPIREPQDNSEVNNVDWLKCFICQEKKKEKLQCSFNVNAQDESNIQSTYSDLADRMLAFKKEGVMPVSVDFDALLAGGDNLGQSLFVNKAKHHKSCKLMFSSSKLERSKGIKSGDSSRSNDESQILETRPTSSRKSRSMNEEKEVCFFCNMPEDNKNPLHLVLSFRLDQRVRRCSKLLDDTILHAKLQQGDMIAQDAVYHRKCILELYRKASVRQLEGHYTDEQRQLHGIAFSEIVSFIEETSVSSEDSIPLFKLSDLNKMYCLTLEELGLKVEGRIHSTRLKHRILAQFEDLREFREGREVILSFESKIGEALSCAASIDYDDEGYVLAEAARIIRRDVFSHNQEKFNGQYAEECQEFSTPKSLKALVTMILRGHAGTETNNPYFKQAMLTLSQLLNFNMTKRTRIKSSSAYHTQTREPPVAIYIGQMIHSHTRKLSIVDKLCHLGLCISPDRLMSISTTLGNTALEKFERENVVCPINMCNGLFTVGAIDNIDINPTSGTAMSSFHGTAASLHQKVFDNSRLETNDNERVLSTDKFLKDLPLEYTEVPPAYLPSAITLPDSAEEPSRSAELDVYEDETKWLRHVRESTDDMVDGLSWAAYNANKCTSLKNADISSLLPMWRDSSKSPAMIKHAINVIVRAVNHLNPGQTPVVTLDQPLYAISKSIQWFSPNDYGMKKLIVMLGPLHTQMAFMSTLGDWLENSGWTTLIYNAKVTRSGVAQSLLSGHDVIRTKYAHQVTACALDTLMYKAYNQSLMDDSFTDFQSWRSHNEQQYPLFRYWSIALKLEMNLLIFLKSIRNANFSLYKAAVERLLPWFFSLDHYNYARWLSIHWYDMATLDQTNPDINDDFEKGSFVIERTSNPFSSMGIDQCHEQLNKVVKGDGGAVGLTEDEDKLRRWMICGPEVARLVNEYEDASVLTKKDSTEFRHHEETPGFQKRFKEHFQSLVAEFEKLGNPFLCQVNDNDLIQLDTRDVMGEEVIKTINDIEELGLSQAKTFITERIVKKQKPLEAPIKKNKLKLFSNANTSSSQSATRTEKKDLKKDVKMFAQLYIATQVRGGDIQELFNHETRKEPPSLAKAGEIRSGNKSDLLSCLKAEVIPSQDVPTVGASVLEGSVMVNIAKPGKEKTFKEYADNVFLPIIVSELSKVDRVDIVFDTYRKDSLKATARKKRGKGIRRKVEAHSQPPKNWASFLRIDENKTELFRFLSKAIVQAASIDMNVVCAFDDMALCSKNRDMSMVSPCNQEEGDTRVFLHIKDMVYNGESKVKIRTVDTDVIVIGISLFERLRLDELWIEFGTGKNKQYYAIHALHQKLGSAKSQALSFFHAFTGCDQVSFFCSCKKTKAWNTWQNFPEITEVFMKLGAVPSKQDVIDSIPKIERFVALMYKRTTNCLVINEARREMFVKDGRDLETIPPTAAALYEHVLRASFMAGYVWYQSLLSCPSLPNVEEWGWKLENGRYSPRWTQLPEASVVVRELIKCRCNPEKGCSGKMQVFAVRPSMHRIVYMQW